MKIEPSSGCSAECSSPQCSSGARRGGGTARCSACRVDDHRRTHHARSSMRRCKRPKLHERTSDENGSGHEHPSLRNRTTTPKSTPHPWLRRTRHPLVDRVVHQCALFAGRVTRSGRRQGEELSLGVRDQRNVPDDFGTRHDIKVVLIGRNRSIRGTDRIRGIDASADGNIPQGSRRRKRPRAQIPPEIPEGDPRPWLNSFHIVSTGA